MQKYGVGQTISAKGNRMGETGSAAKAKAELKVK